MQTFKLTPKPESDYRLEIKELKYRCKLENNGFRHDKLVYGFSPKLTDVTKLQALRMDIVEIPFLDEQLDLAKSLAERNRTKSKIDHLRHAQEFEQVQNEEELAAAQSKLQALNDKVQSLKETLGIQGTIKHLKL
ncbi:MAG: hypothetical protein HWE30_12265 [Methylocystaceae bacterium]|nr:hypothetical protein [Methylocystaceae bacterium]